jgi:RimJ/RimL family protein N-acetyltransferase
MVSLEELKTRRLNLTRIRLTDVEDLEHIYSDPTVMASLGGVRSARQIEELIQAELKQWEQYGFGFWTARDTTADRFVGLGGLRHATVDGSVRVNVGFALRPEVWGQGLATELAIASLRVGFTDIALPEIISFTVPSNSASRRVLEKSGLSFERNILHQGLTQMLYREVRQVWLSKVAIGPAV